VARLCGRAGRLAARDGGFRPGQKFSAPGGGEWARIPFPTCARTLGSPPGHGFTDGVKGQDGVYMCPNGTEVRACAGRAVPYDALGVFGTVLRELAWEMPIFYWRAVPKNPNAS
jgi:hypothetical protein